MAPGWMDSVRQRDMPDICSVPSTKLKVAGTIALHLRMEKSHTRTNFGVVNGLVVPVLLGTAYIVRFIKLIHPAGKKIVPHHFPPVSIITVSEAKSTTKKNNTEIHHEVESEMSLLVTTIRGEPKSITVA